MERKTPLYDKHIQHHGNMVPFAGYLLPEQYEQGVIEEHMAVRTKAGLFDVSHMGEVTCQGKDALKNLNQIMTNDFTDMVVGQARYTPMCHENGGMVDDLIVYKRGEDDYYIVVNAANKDKDFNWMVAHQFGAVEFKDISESVAQLAIQGPLAPAILAKITADQYIPQKYYHAVFDCLVAGIPCIVSWTGYTGENGYEIFTAADDGPKMWDALLEAGQSEGLIPCGLAARDTLRLESAMPLYGHEMDDTVDPLEASLSFAVKMTKEEFIGKKAIIEKGDPAIKRVGLKVVGRGIIREQQRVLLDGVEVGHTTSGTHCPYLGYPIAMALLDSSCTQIGTKVEVEVRNKKVVAEIVALPFYKKGQTLTV